MTISRYVLVDKDNHEDDHEYESYDEAKAAAGDDHAVIERTYSFTDSELVYTPSGASTWPPKPVKHPVQFGDETLTPEWRTYSNGRHALRLNDADGGVYATASVNLPDVELAHDEICVKDYSENEGMLAALIAAGIVEDTGRRATSGHVTIPIGHITAGALEEAQCKPKT